MKLTKTQYKKLKELTLIASNPSKVSNYRFMCTILYIVENGCKWMIFPKRYEWHTIYIKFNRWPKNGTMAKAIAFFL